LKPGAPMRVHGAMAGILDKVDYRPDTLVWSAEGGKLDLLHRAP
jgi:hydrogen cyanide synthase HcnB